VSQSTTPAIDGPLLAYLRDTTGQPELAFRTPPSAISGGYDTRIFAFELKDAPAPFAGPLVIRIFQAAHHVSRALGEGAVQNALADAGYPVPRVLSIGTDPSILGGAFTIMPLAPGHTLLSDIGALVRRGPRILVDMHARLHAIDPAPVMRAVEAAGVALPPFSLEASLKALRIRAEAPGLEGLLDGLRWLETHQPPVPAARSVLHGDFHPGNILINQGRVTGVIDWPGFSIGDPAADVAVTRVLLTTGPLDVPAWARRPADLVRQLLARRYTSGYRKRRPLPDANLRYYEALRCFRAMLQVSESRVAARNGSAAPRMTYAWGAPEQVRRMTALFHSVSGTRLRLPD
jgi:aminoglycoside phosphotransferase (APT) family kinase protein